MILVGVRPHVQYHVYIHLCIITTIYTFQVSHNKDTNSYIVCSNMNASHGLFNKLAFSTLCTYMQ